MNSTPQKQFLQRLILTLMVGVCLCYAPRLTAQRYHFHNLNVDEGLIQSQATCLAQDKTGNLWIGTLGGLSKYDGRNFTNYTVRDGLLHNMVFSVAADPNGNIWIGGIEGLSRFDGRSFLHFRRKLHLARTTDYTQQIMVVNDTAWWRVQGELYYVAQGKIKYFPTPEAKGFVSSMMVGKDGLWIVKGGQLYRHTHNAWEIIDLGIPPEEVQSGNPRVFGSKDGSILIALSTGIYKTTDAGITSYIPNDNQTSYLSGIQAAVEDNNGTIWLGTASGAIKVSSGGVQYYNKRNGLSDNSITDVLKDSEGSIWMASDGQGLFRFSGTQFSGIDESMGLPSAQVMSIAFNGRDSLFIGTYDAGLYVFKDGKVTPLSFPSNPVPAITSLCYTPYSTLWIGTRGRGLWSYENGIFKQYATPERDFLSNYINSVYIDTFNRLWIGFRNGVMVREDDMFKIADTNKSPVYSFLTIGYDSTLIATESGLRLFHAGESAPFVTHTIIDSSKIQCFIILGNELWLGSGDNGVIRYNMRTHKTMVIDKNDGLRSDFIYNIVDDNDGNVWVGTGFGIHKISIRANQEPRVTFYGKAQGITGMESNINSRLKLPDGSIWFGTTNGALHYNPHTAVVVSAASSIVLQSVKIAGENLIDHQWYDSADKWYNIPYNLRLPYKKNNIAFTFQAITLSGAQQALYRYRMDGLEAPWSDWSAANSVTYSALPPGSYIFHVQSQSDAGTNAPELIYQFEIITPYHKTNWFRFAIFATCIFIGILLQYIYNSRKERRQRLLSKLRSEELGKIRIRTAEDFHDEIGNKLTRINVLTNVLRKKEVLSPETTRILGQIEENTTQLYSGTRDILWSLKPANDGLYEILHRIREFGMELFQDTDILFTFTESNDNWRKFRLDMEMSRNLIMIFKEALNNTLKYANAKNVVVEVTIKQKNVLHIILKDDGEGFDVHAAKKGNGLANMNTRAGRLNGKLYIDSQLKKGTIISLTFKIPPNR